MSTNNNTKERLISTAIELIWQSSYGSVSVDEICKTADVKKGSFYHFFPSKVDLAVAAMEQFYQDAKPLFEEVFDRSRSPIERFEKLAEVILRKQTEVAKQYGHVCGCPFASLGSEMAGQEALIREKVENTMRKYKSKYYEQTIQDMVDEDLLPSDTDVKDKSQQLYSYILGQVMVARIQNDLKPLKKNLKDGLFKILDLTLETV